MAADSGRLIAVRSELVREQLVQHMLDAVMDRLGTDPPLEATAALACVPEPRSELPGQALSRAGYWSRVVEREMFEPAREPIGWLMDELDGSADADAVGALSWTLAQREPLERPEPGDADAVMWRIPGPGGHVRHYLALETLAAVGPSGRGSEGGLQEKSALGSGKRDWTFGFLVACCIESAAQVRTGTRGH